jgi:CRISPR-associated protein Cmr2
MKERSLVIISIGPVQDFIASARRCQDLWYGSWLLSHLARQVAAGIARDCGSEALIFPGSGNLDDDDDASVANRVVALIPSDRAGEIAERARGNVRGALEEFANRIFDRIEEHPDVSRFVDRERALAQIVDMIELQWVAVPCLADSGEAYNHARSRAERLMSARKATRLWSQPGWADAVPKSSIDGLRESVIQERLYDLIATGSMSPEEVYGVLRIRSAERLCGVGLLKRLGEELDSSHPSFHSTSHIAATPLLAHFERPEARVAFERFLDRLDEILVASPSPGAHRAARSARLRRRSGFQGADDACYDGELFFEGRLYDLAAEWCRDTPQRRRELLRARRELLDALGIEGELVPYYGLLMADGDRMGQLIDAQPSMARHRELSTRLERFAAEARKIVAEHRGSAIYAGGDDVLAMVPLDTAIACARRLADRFAEMLAEFGSSPTLSVGMAIVHHLTHLGQARKLAQSAERLAKCERNSLAIIIDKRAGAQTEIVGSWADDDAIDRRIAEWEEIIEAAELSHGFIYEVESLARLVDPGLGATEPPLGFDALSVRLLERAMARKTVKGAVGLPDALAERLRSLASGGAPANLDRIAAELYVALQIHRCRRTARPSERRTSTAVAGDEVRA